MSFWRFLRTSFTKAFHRSLHGGHVVHQVCVYVAGALVLLSLFFGIRAAREEEPVLLIVAPLVGAVLILLFDLVWQAYRLYKEEHDKRVALEKGLAALQETLDVKSAGLRAALDEKRSSEAVLSELRAQLEAEQVQVADVKKLVEKENRTLDIREQLGKFIIQGQHLQEACDSSRSLDQNEKVREWAEQVEKFLLDAYGLAHVARFRNGAGLPAPHIDHSIPYGESWERVRIGLARLAEFLAESSRQ